MRACFTYILAKGRLLERERELEVAGDLPDGAVTNPTKTHHLRLELGVAAVGVSTEASFAHRLGLAHRVRNHRVTLI